MAANSQTMWADHRATIMHLYAIKTLQQVMDEMKDRHSFTATRKQWTKQLSKWGLDKKNIKPAEYRAMLRKKRERETNDPTKGTQFILHGIEVPPDKIARFESRKGRNKGVNGRQGDALTPPELTCRTPPIREDPGGTRSNLTINMTTTSNPAASDNRNLIQTQLLPKRLTTSMGTIQPRLPTRNPPRETFDWFEDYANYTKSINGSPTTAENSLMDILLRFQKVPNNYEDERAYKLFTDGIHVEHPCDKCKTLKILWEVQNSLRDEDEKPIESWTRATVRKAIQFNSDPIVMINVGYAIGGMYQNLGRPQEAKLCNLKLLSNRFMMRK